MPKVELSKENPFEWLAPSKFALSFSLLDLEPKDQEIKTLLDGELNEESLPGRELIESRSRKFCDYHGGKTDSEGGTIISRALVAAVRLNLDPNLGVRFQSCHPLLIGNPKSNLANFRTLPLLNQPSDKVPSSLVNGAYHKGIVISTLCAEYSLEIQLWKPQLRSLLSCGNINIEIGLDDYARLQETSLIGYSQFWDYLRCPITSDRNKSSFQFPLPDIDYRLKC
jgi:hypothetical protein